MTMLVLEEFMAVALEQAFTLERKLIVSAIRPYIYAHNVPAGTFTLDLVDSQSNVVASQAFTSQEIYDGLATTDLYAHAFFRVLFDHPVPMPKGDYIIRITPTFYSFSENSYLAWVREYEDLKVPINYVPSVDSENPLAFEIWSYESCEY